MKRSDAVSQALIEDLRSGRHAVGDTISSESELCKRFNVSRSTVRFALSRMQDLGLIQRRQGAPTRVIATSVSPIYVHSMTASGDLLNFAGPTRREIRETSSVVADEELALRLDQKPGRHWVWIRQARYVGRKTMPAVWTDVYLTAEFGDIVADLPDYPGLIYTLLEQRHGIIIEEIRQTIVASTLSREIADVFEAAEGDSALEITRRYHDVSGHCRIVTISVQPAVSFKYEITLSRQGSDASL